MLIVPSHYKQEKLNPKNSTHTSPSCTPQHTKQNHQYSSVGNLKHLVGKNSCSSFCLHESISNV